MATVEVLKPSTAYDPAQVNAHREYHKAQTPYFFPAGTDEAEWDRLNAQHYGIKAYFKGNRHGARWPKTPRRILELGVGTGAWATEVAAEFPKAQVVGVDVVQPRLGKTPQNFTFVSMNVLDDVWPFEPGSFDVVNCRFLLMHMPNFERVLNKAIDVTAPGGILMLADPASRFQAEGRPVPPEASKLYDVYWGYCKTQGIVPGTGPLFAPLLAASKKFSEVHELVLPACMGPWPKNERLHPFGEGMRKGIIDGARSLNSKVFEFGLTGEIVEGMVRQVLDPENRLYVDEYFVWARKKQEGL
ncbi:S-adenosyl-L-methionine-dependent methyltransferase [Dacryopinax primogenitus]|uniref:S-adenosyl-L-methionine-dependent methyltransferase n=1 Tax=Dacryopinax primogenitus (strain DJM 731) TaxID=1858805 RepID=M5G188_DACPD|nr:S-adenosyl-L-methionine-dependent methyltransferase [Dacryopinax primogenitus]EJU04001.1 S-adenosyl-L-methionine-dependent methyltransferase [Dacryopinax primogenitus]